MDIENKHSNEKEVRVANKRTFSCIDLVLRFLAFALTLVAAILLGVDKQTTYVSMQVIPTLPPLNIPVTAKWHYLSAFVYFVVANSVACAYAVISLILTMANGGKIKGLTLMITIMDIVMVALLFSGGSAAAAIGVIGREGNSHVRWNKVCNVFGKFCDQVAAALGLSGAGAVVFLSLVMVAIFNLHKKQ